jgi:hypothetical protein
MEAFGELLFHLLDGVRRRCGCDDGKAEKLIEVDDIVLSGLYWIDGDTPNWGKKCFGAIAAKLELSAHCLA